MGASTKNPTSKLMFKCQNKDLDPVLVMVYRVLPPMIDCTAYCDDSHLCLNLSMSSFDPNNQDSKSDWRELVGKCLDRHIARGNSSPYAWWDVSSKIVNAVWAEGLRKGMHWQSSDAVADHGGVV